MSFNAHDWGVVAMGCGIKEWTAVPDLPSTAKAIADNYRTLSDSQKVMFLKDAKDGVDQAIHLLQQAAEKVAAEMAGFSDDKSPPPPLQPPPVRSRHDGEPPVTRLP